MALDPSARRHLSRDPVMRGLMRAAGRCTLAPERGRSPYEALIRAIAHQQLTGKAANTILSRCFALYGDGRFPEPAELLATDDARLRAAGFSRAKVASLKDIAARTLDGTVPPRRALSRLRDEAIIERLTAVRGVGRWTVEMFLIFTLGRPDVLPVDDYGVKKGFVTTFRSGHQAHDRLLARGVLGLEPRRRLQRLRRVRLPAGLQGQQPPGMAPDVLPAPRLGPPHEEGNGV